MNWRAAGCGTLAAAAFIGLGLLGISRALAPAECPEGLPYDPAPYAAVGERSTEPRLEGVDEPLMRAGRTGFGLASWEVWVEPGRAPAASAEPLPQRMVLDCGDGSFQAYQRAAE